MSDMENLGEMIKKLREEEKKIEEKTEEIKEKMKKMMDHLDGRDVNFDADEENNAGRSKEPKEMTRRPSRAGVKRAERDARYRWSKRRKQITDDNKIRVGVEEGRRKFIKRGRDGEWEGRNRKWGGRKGEWGGRDAGRRGRDRQFITNRGKTIILNINV